jgi:hypothetical protein
MIYTAGTFSDQAGKLNCAWRLKNWLYAIWGQVRVIVILSAPSSILSAERISKRQFFLVLRECKIKILFDWG